MKTTNAIEQALKEKAYNEIQELVGRFIKDIETSIIDKYDCRTFRYEIKENSNSDGRFFTVRQEHLDSVLIRLLVDAYRDRMVDCKSAELINKLNLDI